MNRSESPRRRALDPVKNDNDYVEVLTMSSPMVRLVKTQILPGQRSKVPVGDSMQGTLRGPVVPGRSVSFSDSSRSTSEVVAVQVTTEGVVNLRTSTSVYKLVVAEAHAGRLRSLKYLRRNYLDYNEEMPDGFYDGGHGMTFRVGADGKLGVSSSREVILVDAGKDVTLGPKLEMARKFIENARTLQEKIQMLAMFVSNSLGGSQLVPGSSMPGIVDLTDQDVDQRKMSGKNAGDILMLGHLNYGVCRHRALMFKYLADRLGIPSRLVRGKTSDWHVWNVVQLHGKNYVVDVMQQPWNLMEENSPEVDQYKRIFNRRGVRVMAGIGGRSITRP